MSKLFNAIGSALGYERVDEEHADQAAFLREELARIDAAIASETEPLLREEYERQRMLTLVNLQNVIRARSATQQLKQEHKAAIAVTADAAVMIKGARDVERLMRTTPQRAVMEARNTYAVVRDTSARIQAAMAPAPVTTARQKLRVAPVSQPATPAAPTLVTPTLAPPAQAIPQGGVTEHKMGDIPSIQL